MEYFSFQIAEAAQERAAALQREKGEAEGILQSLANRLAFATCHSDSYVSKSTFAQLAPWPPPLLSSSPRPSFLFVIVRGGWWIAVGVDAATACGFIENDISLSLIVLYV
jgi:hypothetical protein